MSNEGIEECLDWYNISSVKAALRAAIQVAIAKNLLLYRANMENAKARRDGILDGEHLNAFVLNIRFISELTTRSVERKLQALYGNAMALFLADMLIEAIHKLAASNSSSRIEL